MKKVLIIDDQPEIRVLIGRALDAFGYEHQEAHNGHDAIRICQGWNPDAVLTDIFMPDKDGLEIIREIRKASPNVAILAMSGGGGAGDLDVLRTARLMGARHVLTKPFPMQSLKKALDELIGESDPGPGTPD